MAIRVAPDAFQTQRRGDVVTYELPWADWDAGLGRQARASRVWPEAIKGTACGVELVDDNVGHQITRVIVRATAPGFFRITRLVTIATTPPEQRRRSFRVLVE